MALVVVVIAAVAGVGVGHAVWKSSSASSNVAAPANPGSGGSVFGGGTSGGGNSGTGGSGTGSSGTGTSNASGGPSDVAAIARKVAPALVDINTTLSYQQEEAAGTGIVLTSNGEVLTNNHVIDGATKISVTDIGNGKTYTASVVGYDRTEDIAILALKGASGLTSATIGDSSGLSTGQSVVAIGNAGGTGGTPSNAGGSITGLNQSITASDEGDGSSEQLTGLIQTDAAIQPGDSGGSLVDTAGRVIGIDTAASAGFSFESGGTEGFSIPINKALTIGRDITDGKASTKVHIGATAFLGVRVSAAGASSGGFGAGSSGGSATGAAVASVVAGGAAQQAGLVAGDTITAIGGKSIASTTDLTTVISAYHPGQVVPISWVDSNGQTQSSKVTLASGPPQ